MAITLEEYLKKHEELTLQEQENKINHGMILDQIEEKYRQNQQRNILLYREMKHNENAAYMEKVQALKKQKRELKTERLLTYQQEQMALGKEVSNQ